MLYSRQRGKFLYYKAKKEAYFLSSRILNSHRLSKLDETVKNSEENLLILRKEKLAKLYLPTLKLETSNSLSTFLYLNEYLFQLIILAQKLF